MPKFCIQIAETRNYELEIEAETETEARDAAMRAWSNAPETGQWEIPDQSTEIVAVTAAE